MSRAHEVITEGGETRCSCGLAEGSPSNIEYHAYVLNQQDEDALTPPDTRIARAREGLSLRVDTRCITWPYLTPSHVEPQRCGECSGCDVVLVEEILDQFEKISNGIRVVSELIEGHDDAGPTDILRLKASLCNDIIRLMSEDDQ